MPALPEAAALKRAFEDEGGDAAACLAHGIHLIAVQSEDGTLVVGDSHRYEAAPQPFADETIDALILRELHATLEQELELEQAQVTQRSVGIYPRSASETCLIAAPDDATRVVVVSSGTGASTAFGIAEDVFSAW